NWPTAEVLLGMCEILERGLPAQSPEEATAYWTGTDPFFLAPESAGARAQARDLLLANPQNWRPEKNRFESRPRRTAYPNLHELDLPRPREQLFL
ncbi:hypothetical protein C4556_00715, partial [Candidatus Parcubacteria bacterium]